MKNQWMIPEETLMIGPYPAIKHKKTKELCLAGKYGEIWEIGPESYKAVITSHRIANKNLNSSAKKGDEILVEFDADKLNFWIKELKIPVKQIKRQLMFANSFGG